MKITPQKAETSGSGNVPARSKPPKSEAQRAARAYDRDNLAAAKLAKSDPVGYAALQDWADEVIAKHEGSAEK